MSLHPAMKRRGMREWYAWLAEVTADRPEWTFMNYGTSWSEARDGVAPPQLPLPIAERNAARLYWKVASAGAARAPHRPLEGEDVLEVGSGRGGGAAYLAANAGPSRYVGCELIEAAVALARRQPAAAALSFVVGDAERLPFEGPSFDRVINVESSHAYGSAARFFAEVARVLRPGGALSMCDFRAQDALDAVRAEIGAAGLEITRFDDVSPQVIASLDERAPALEAQVVASTPSDKLDAVRAFCVLPGTLPYRHLADGRVRYFLCHARRP